MECADKAKSEIPKVFKIVELFQEISQRPSETGTRWKGARLLRSASECY